MGEVIGNDPGCHAGAVEAQAVGPYREGRGHHEAGKTVGAKGLAAKIPGKATRRQSLGPDALLGRGAKARHGNDRASLCQSLVN